MVEVVIKGAVAVVMAVTMVVMIIQGVNYHLLSTSSVPVSTTSHRHCLHRQCHSSILISVFTKHVLNASCGLGAMLGAGDAKMTIMWSLTQGSSCPVGESLRNRALQPKEMSLITEEHTMLGQQRGPGGFSEKDLKDQLEYYRQRIGKGIPESRNSTFTLWKKGRWFKKRSKVAVVPAWEQASF